MILQQWHPLRWKPSARAAAGAALGLALVVSWELAGYGQISVHFNRITVAFRDGDTRCTISAGTDIDARDVNSSGQQDAARIEWSAANPPADYPGSCLALCTQLGYANETGANVPIDTLIFEVFKFAPGSNPLDEGSTPPLRTFTFSAIGEMFGANVACTDGGCFNNFPLGIRPVPVTGQLPPGANRGFCVGWDGSYNIEGEFGRSNGQFGFRVKANTHRQHPQQGNITIETSPPGVYPALDAATGALQAPITVDVTDIHVVRTTPTVVGERPSVSAQPYNVRYRLSKDALVSIDVYKCDTSGNCNEQVRNLLSNVPRVGEGTPLGTLANGDFWDGRNNNGDLLPPAHYQFRINAFSSDNGQNSPAADDAFQVLRQVSIDPLQLTDISVTPLLDLSTSLALLNYTLTEDATVYVDIYPPGTTFRNTSNFSAGLEHNFNNRAPTATSECPFNLNGEPVGVNETRLPSSCLGPELNGVVPTKPVRNIREQKRSRTSVLTFWDGRDREGKVVEDGDYTFALYATVPSSAGAVNTTGNAWPERTVFTSETKQGVLSVTRGLPGISQITPKTTVMGSTPAVAGLDPFQFTYSITRDGFVSLKVYRATDTSRANPVKTLVSRETRQPGFQNTERWIDGTSDSGRLVPPGSYVAELTVEDPFFSNKVSTTAVTFPVNLLRVTDVIDTALLTGATDRVFVSYQLSKPMEVTWTIYPVGSLVNWTDPAKPPCQGVLDPPSGCPNVLNEQGQAVEPVFQVTNFRPGRPLKVTESWDGRDEEGLLVRDGLYTFTVVARSSEPVETSGLEFANDRIIGTISIARGPTTFTTFGVVPSVAQVSNSSEVVTLPPFEIDFVLTRTSSVTVTVLNNESPPQVVATVVPGKVVFPSVLNREFWDGRDDSGNFVKAGFYTLRTVASDVAAQLIQPATFQQTISVDPLVIYDVATAPITFDNPNAVIAYQVSESMKVAVKIYKPGTSFDSEGNASPPEKLSLVRAIVGVKPGRTPITDFWDGKDQQLTLAPDGNYLFKIFGSTDLASIDSITGSAKPGAPLAAGTVVSELPVTRGASADPRADFDSNTIVYPNPLRAASGTIKIRVPLRARVTMKIFTVAGDLVREHDFGERPPDSYSEFVWKRDNAFGRKVASGVYYVVVRQETTAGDRDVFQAVKKVLIP